MKQLIKLFCVIIAMTLFTNVIISQKDVKNVVVAYKSNLGLYELDSYAVRDITLLPNKTQKETIEFTVFPGRRYKLIFCTTGVAGQLPLSIYDKPEGNKNRRKVYDNSNEIDNEFCSFEPKKIATYYIECDIPTSGTNNNKGGKIVMLIGLQENAEY